MKKVTLIFSLLLIACSSSDDSCDCRYSDTLGFYVPKSLSEENISENWTKLSQEQKNAIRQNECSDCD